MAGAGEGGAGRLGVHEDGAEDSPQGAGGAGGAGSSKSAPP